jgi:uncharacterized protein YsxB (DUF464 family)
VDVAVASIVCAAVTSVTIAAVASIASDNVASDNIASVADVVSDNSYPSGYCEQRS